MRFYMSVKRRSGRVLTASVLLLTCDCSLNRSVHRRVDAEADHAGAAVAAGHATAVDVETDGRMAMAGLARGAAVDRPETSGALATSSFIQLTPVHVALSSVRFLSFSQSLHHDVSVEQSLSLLHSKFNDTTLLSARVAAASKSWLQRKRDRDVQQIRDALHASAHGKVSTSGDEQQRAKRARVRAEQ